MYLIHKALAIAIIATQAINTPASVAIDANKNQFCNTLTRHLPSVSQSTCVQTQLLDSGARSVNGVPLMTRDVLPDDAKLRVLVIGGIHGDEMSSTSVAMHWIGLVKQTPVEVHWRFIPLLNPDGLYAKPSKRVNANGVDLNRNFPTPNWHKQAKIYWEQRTKKDPRRWPGPGPLSEPESKFLHAQMERFKPNLIVSIHAPFGVLDFDGPTVPPGKLGRLYLDQVGIYPGSLGNYGGIHKRIPVVTIELPNAQRTPLDSEMRQMWLDLTRWMSERIQPDEDIKATPVKLSTKL
ncbi:MAG TPA: M14 family murein peptide amidase A [Burkholderiaceae bacterium]|nr:M14 family murein peptide amidase A [Burkholderiaceae bacterium]